jgi:CPA2 family monovalent cation:H+ antiporter-2
VISESDLSTKAASEALPLQDAFAVLFFVAVGMLFDPMVLVREPIKVVAVVLIVMIGKSLAALAIVLAFGRPWKTALTISASLAQIGEFSFILAALGLSLGLLPPQAQSLIVAGALISITLNPLMFGAIASIESRLAARRSTRMTQDVVIPRNLRAHTVLVGHGRVGGRVAAALAARRLPYVVVEADLDNAAGLLRQGTAVVYGDAARPGVLEHAGLKDARLLVVTTPDAFQARAAIELARRVQPEIDIVVRTHSDSERDYLESKNVGKAVMGEHELAEAMARYAVERLGPA